MNESRFTQEDIHTRDAIAAVIEDTEWNILIQDHVKLARWTIPIGKVRAGEVPEEVLQQELLEELGIRVVRYEKLWICDWTYDYDGVLVKISTHVFRILEYTGEIQNLEPQKHASIDFKSLIEIRDLPKISNATAWVLNN